MHTQESHHTIAYLLGMIERKELFVNKDYQRNPKLWPSTARSYFIDTILEEFPFPKLYFYEITEKKKGGEYKTITEIVDGQQRINTIIEFVNNRLTLGEVSQHHHGMSFENLNEEQQSRFMGYSVAVDVITRASRTEILEMFRRINAYTLPLNAAEKRHSSWEGEFKWFINNLADKYSPVLSEYGVLTQRQIVRMGDTELFSDIIAAIYHGIISSSGKILNNLYRDNDKKFDDKKDVLKKVTDSFDFIIENFGDMRRTFLFKSYVFHSLSCALIHNRFGLPGAEKLIEIKPTRKFVGNLDRARQGLEALAGSHEDKDEQGPFGEYVWACSAGSNRAKQRSVRIKYLCQALRGELLL